MKKILQFSKYLLAAAILIAFSIAPAQSPREAAASEDKLITVLNPAVSDVLANRVPLTPRLDTIKGKTIYLVDTNYEGLGRTPVLEQMKVWFDENMPEVNVVFKLKRGNYTSNDDALWREIATNKGDGVIIGVAG